MEKNIPLPVSTSPLAMSVRALFLEISWKYYLLLIAV